MIPAWDKPVYFVKGKWVSKAIYRNYLHSKGMEYREIDNMLVEMRRAIWDDDD